jgi:hypothetical protein
MHRPSLEQRKVEENATMCKPIYLQSGYLARCGKLWYEPGILIVVEQHERLNVYAARADNMPGIRRGSYAFEQLDIAHLPVGLSNVDQGATRPAPRLVA